MSLTPSSNRVLIIGAGVGGLALAHGLKQAGIAFHVFERDPASSPRAQGYRFRINPVGAEALHSVMPSSAWPQFESSCGALPKGMTKLDACPNQPSVALHRPPPPPPTREGFKPYNADRTAFRQLLIDTLGGEAHVSCGKRCIAVENGAGGVTATFDDGCVETGSLLVGADGVRSVVRRLCFPSTADGRTIEPVDTQARCIYGKTPLTPATEALFSDDLRSETLFVQDRTKGATVSLYLEPMRFDRSSASSSAQQQLPDDYVYWVLGAPRSIFFGAGKGTDEPVLSHSQAADLALRVTAHWDAAVRVAIEQQDRSQTALLRMMTAVPRRIASWPAPAGVDALDPAAAVSSHRRVTLLGDAVHVMPPAGGNGANTALRDAALLAGLLAEAKRSGELGSRLGEVVARYEREMKLYASEAVAGAAGGGRWMFDQQEFEVLEEYEELDALALALAV